MKEMIILDGKKNKVCDRSMELSCLFGVFDKPTNLQTDGLWGNNTLIELPFLLKNLKLEFQIFFFCFSTSHFWTCALQVVSQRSQEEHDQCEGVRPAPEGQECRPQAQLADAQG